MDLRDGRVAAKVVSGAVNTSAITKIGQPIRVTYEAVDSAGNLARRQRLVTVYDSCNATDEFRCRDTLQCSVRRICGKVTELANSITAVASKTRQTASQRPPDTTPPVLVVSGPGVPYITSKGASGLITTVYVGDTYTDAGAVATDEVSVADGAAPTFVHVRVTSSILSPAGQVVTAVSTANPTGNDTASALPYLITYSAVDGSGNAATSVRRRVYVLCRPPEFACPGDLASDPLTCSSDGICGLANAPTKNKLASSGSGSSNTGGWTASDSLPGGYSASDSSESQLVPRFVLNGDPTITISEDSSYPVCRDGITTECEAGVTATLLTQGDLNGLLRACATGIRDPQPFDVVGLQYCDIDTRVPGNYTISFHLTWPSVGEIVVYRHLVVQAQCEGERVCSDGRCSEDLACASELGLESSAGATSSSNGTATAGTTGADWQGSAVTFTNSPPTLTLNMSEVVGTQVSVSRGVPYKVCAEGQSPTVDRPCETLGLATDMEDGDLTSRIALCPPDDCASTQCRVHWADRKQPSECGVDTVTGAVGSTYRLQVVVYDTKGANATAERVITVVSPCASGQSYCEEALASGGSQFVCSDVSCEEREQLAAGGAIVDVIKPRLFLLPGSHADDLSLAEAAQTMFMAFGQPAPISLAPCANWSEGAPAPPARATCAAIANDTTDGDVSADIVEFVVPLCSAVSDGTDAADIATCESCSIAGLTAGVCLPGRYRITYTVAGSDGGVTTSQTLDVAVEQRTNTVIEMSLFPNRTAEDSTSLAFAEVYAADLNTNATARYEALLPVLEAFGVLADEIRALSFPEAPQAFEATDNSTQLTYYAVKVTVNVTSGYSDFLDVSGLIPPPNSTVNGNSANGTVTNGTVANGTANTQPGARRHSRSLVVRPVSADRGAGAVGTAAPQPLGHVIRLLPVGEEQEVYVNLDPTHGDVAGEAPGASLGRSSSRAEPATGTACGRKRRRLGTRSPPPHTATDDPLGEQPCDMLDEGESGAGGLPRRATPESKGSPSDPWVASAPSGDILARLHAMEEQVELILDLLMLSGPQSPGTRLDIEPSAGYDDTETRARAQQRRRRLGELAALPAYGAGAARQARRALQQSISCNTGAISKPSASRAAAVGLQSVGAVQVTCATPSVLPSTVVLSLTVGATNEGLRLMKDLVEQQVSLMSSLRPIGDLFSVKDQVYKKAIVLISTEASTSLAYMVSRVESAIRALHRTQAAQASGVTAISTTLNMLRATLNEAEATISRALITATTILSGVLEFYNATDAEYSAYATCIFLRGSTSTFAFNVSRVNGGDAAFYEAASQQLGAQLAASRRRRALVAGFQAAAKTAGAAGLNSEAGSDGVRTSRPSSLPAWLRRGFSNVASAVTTLLPTWVLPRTGIDTAASSSSGNVGHQFLATRKDPRVGLAEFQEPYVGSPLQDRPLRSAGERILLGSGGGPSGPFSSNTSSEKYAFEAFDGYSLPSGQGYNYSLWELRHTDRNRFAGAKNKVLVGLLLHQERRTAAEIKSTTGTDGRICRVSSFDSLVVGCDADSINDNRAPSSGDLGGIGNDPVFNYHSSLFNGEVFPSDYYNTTKGSSELNSAGYPYGFYHEPLERFPPGYPLLFDTRMSAQRAEQAITFVRDGNYLSSSFTKSLRAQLVTYNPDAQVFGYWRVDFSWADSGVIDAKTYLMGLPAISYGDAIRNMQVSQFLPDFFMLLMIIGYVGMTAYDIYWQLAVQRIKRRALRDIAERRAAVKAAKAARASSSGKCNRVLPGETATVGARTNKNAKQDSSSSSSSSSENSSSSESSSSSDSDSGVKVVKKAEKVEKEKRRRGLRRSNKRRKFKPRMNAKWVTYEAATCIMMIAAIAVFFYYAVRLSVRDEFTSRFNIYDADSFAPARYFLTLRDANAAIAANSNNNSGANNGTLTSVPYAGDAGRWMLPADQGPLNDAGSMFARVDSMYDTLMAYNFLQGFVLAMLVIRWLHYISFQPRLSLVVGTLARALPDLFHYALVAVTCIVLFSAAATLVFGTQVAQLSSLGGSVYLMLKYVLLYEDDHIFTGLLTSSIMLSRFEWTFAGLLYALGPIFFLFVLARFILGFLAWHFHEHSLAVKKRSGVPQDLGRILRWNWQRLRHGAPKNKRMLLLLEAWLARSDTRGVMQLLSRSVVNFKTQLGGLTPSRKSLMGASNTPGATTLPNAVATGSVANAVSPSPTPSFASSVAARIRSSATGGALRDTLRPRLSGNGVVAATTSSGGDGAVDLADGASPASSPLAGASRRKSLLKMHVERKTYDGDAISAALHTVSRARLRTVSEIGHDEVATADAGRASRASGGRALLTVGSQGVGGGSLSSSTVPAAGAVATAATTAGSQLDAGLAGPDAGERPLSPVISGSRSDTSTPPVSRRTLTSSGAVAVGQRSMSSGSRNSGYRRASADVGLGMLSGSALQRAASRIGLLSSASPVEQLQRPSEAEAVALADAVMANLLSRFGHVAAVSADTAAGSASAGGQPPARAPSSGAARQGEGTVMQHNGQGGGGAGGMQAQRQSSSAGASLSRTGGGSWAQRLPSAGSGDAARQAFRSVSSGSRNTAGGSDGGADPGLVPAGSKSINSRVPSRTASAGGPLAARASVPGLEAPPQAGAPAAPMTFTLPHVSPSKEEARPAGGDSGGDAGDGSASGGGTGQRKRRMSITEIPLPPLSLVADLSVLKQVHPRQLEAQRKMQAAGRDGPQQGETGPSDRPVHALTVTTSQQLPGDGSGGTPSSRQGAQVTFGFSPPPRARDASGGDKSSDSSPSRGVEQPPYPDNTGAAAAPKELQEAWRWQQQQPHPQLQERQASKLQKGPQLPSSPGGGSSGGGGDEGGGASGAATPERQARTAAPDRSKYRAWPSIRTPDATSLPPSPAVPRPLPAATAADRKAAAVARSRRKLSIASEALIEEDEEEEQEAQEESPGVPGREGAGPRSTATLAAVGGNKAKAGSSTGSSSHGPGPVAEATESTLTGALTNMREEDRSNAASVLDALPASPPHASGSQRVSAVPQLVPHMADADHEVPVQQTGISLSPPEPTVSATHSVDVPGPEADESVTSPSPEGAVLAHLVACVRALTAHLNAMLAQLLAAGREVEEMASLLSALLATAQSAPCNPADRAAAVRAVFRSYVIEHCTRLLSGRPQELEQPLPQLELPSAAAYWKRLRLQVTAAAAVAAPGGPPPPAAAATALAQAGALPGGLQALPMPLVAGYVQGERERAAAWGRELEERLGDALNQQPSLRRLANEVIDRENDALRMLSAAGTGGGGGGGGGMEGAANPRWLGGVGANTLAKQRRGWGARRRAMAAAQVRQEEQEQQEAPRSPLRGVLVGSPKRRALGGGGGSAAAAAGARPVSPIEMEASVGIMRSDTLTEPNRLAPP